MRLTKRQLKRIIREEKRKLQESGAYPRPQHPMIAQGMANNHLGLLARAVEACLEKGMSMEDICNACEEECLNQTMKDQF